MKKPLVAIITVRCQCNTRELVDLIESVQRAADKLSTPGKDVRVGLTDDSRDRLLKHVLS